VVGTYNIITTELLSSNFEVKMDQKILISFLFSVCMERSKFKDGSTFHKRGRQLK